MKNDFEFIFPGVNNTGDYWSENIIIGDVKVRQQTMASAVVGNLAVGVFGIGFPALQSGVFHGTFTEYRPLADTMVAQGLIESASYAIYIDPSEGESMSPATYPGGNLIFGGLNLDLFEGDLKTFRIVNSNNTTLAENPLDWNIVMTGLQIGEEGFEGKNLADQKGTSIIFDIGTAFNVVPRPLFDSLESYFATATLDPTTGFYDIDCAQRQNQSNGITFSFTDTVDPNTTFSIHQSATESIWPAPLLITGADPNTCVVAIGSFDVIYAGSYIENTFSALLGVPALKNMYMVHDLDNKQLSIAKAAPKPSTEKIVPIPKGGVGAMNHVSGY